MRVSRWNAWLKKAASLRGKYEGNKALIMRELQELKPSIFRSYRSEEALVLLFFLWKTVKMQEALYKRFVSGSKIFMLRLSDSEYFEKFENINASSEELLDIISSERFLLDRLSPLFFRFEGKIRLKDVERGFFSKRISEDSLKQFVDAFSFDMLRYSSEQVKRLHKLVLRKYYRESSALSKLHDKLIFLSVKLKPFLEGSNVKRISLGVYVGTYICFFFGIFNYPLFSFTTSLAREIMTS